MPVLSRRDPLALAFCAVLTDRGIKGIKSVAYGADVEQYSEVTVTFEPDAELFAAVVRAAADAADRDTEAR